MRYKNSNYDRRKVSKLKNFGVKIWRKIVHALGEDGKYNACNLKMSMSVLRKIEEGAQL